MREIKFRGLRTDGKGFAFGLLRKQRQRDLTQQGVGVAYTGEYEYWIDSHEGNQGSWLIIPESIGQYTGLKDKNGKDIYEGDKFSPDIDIEECMAVVRWCDKFSKYVVDSYGYNFHIGEGSQEVYDNEMSICDTIDLGDISSEYLEIIGNIHETPCPPPSKQTK